MDLGAGVCTPSRPRCSACPVLKFCATKGELPDKKPTVRKFREETWAIALVERDGRYLLHRNEAKGLLSGLWQFPKVLVDENRAKHTKREGSREIAQEIFSANLRFKGKDHKSSPRAAIPLHPHPCPDKTLPLHPQRSGGFTATSQVGPLGEALRFFPLPHLHRHAQNRCAAEPLSNLKNLRDGEGTFSSGRRDWASMPWRHQEESMTFPKMGVFSTAEPWGWIFSR
jgi:hypothetical protein